MKIPFYPTRPSTGSRLTSDNVLVVVNDYRARGYIIQPKLNGDRGILVQAPGGVELWNREGTIYRAGEVNLGRWECLSPDTVLDGEIWQGEFYPFEAIVVSAGSLVHDRTAERIGWAIGQSARAGQDWLFETPTNEWLINEITLDADPLTRQWEGVVAKIDGAHYRTMSHPEQEAGTWVRLKWC